MRTIAAVAYLILFFAAPCFQVLAADQPKLKGLGEMSVEEVRAEAKQLYRADVPFAAYIRAITDEAEAAWPKLSSQDRIRYRVVVYWRIIEALRVLTGVEQPVPDTPFVPRYHAAVSISLAFSELKLGDLSKAFHREVFNLPEFQKSDSAYREAVIDLWQRFEKAKLPVPYVRLLLLNQPKMGRDGEQDSSLDSEIGDMYATLGENLTAAEWYAKVPAEGLGPLKAADAYFAAARYGEAERLYRHVSDHLDEWIALKPRLARTAIAEPLEDLNPEMARKHIAARLAEIGRLKEKNSATRPALPATTQDR